MADLVRGNAHEVELARADAVRAVVVEGVIAVELDEGIADQHTAAANAERKIGKLNWAWLEKVCPSVPPASTAVPTVRPNVVSAWAVTGWFSGSAGPCGIHLRRRSGRVGCARIPW